MPGSELDGAGGFQPRLFPKVGLDREYLGVFMILSNQFKALGKKRGGGRAATKPSRSRAGAVGEVIATNPLFPKSPSAAACLGWLGMRFP